MKLTKEIESLLKMIPIPVIDDIDKFEKNADTAYENDLNHCPVCGKGITNPKYFIYSAYGGSAYIPKDNTQYDDTWVMGIGTECRKKLPKEYIFTKDVVYTK